MEGKCENIEQRGETIKLLSQRLKKKSVEFKSIECPFEVCGNEFKVEPSSLNGFSIAIFTCLGAVAQKALRWVKQNWDLKKHA